ncbi:MAG: DNA repair protein RadD [Acidimicrobiales bacterium]|jgi:DNA repair protein RadD
MGADIVSKLRAAGKRVLWIAHRKELIEQAHDKLEQFGLSVGLIKAGNKPDPSAPVQVASIQTLARRDITQLGIDAIVIDECHRTNAKQYQRVLETFPSAYLLGLTATPVRLDGKGLGDNYDSMVVAAKYGDLIEDGFIVPIKTLAPHVPDTSQLRRQAGDFKVGQSEQLMANAKIKGNVLDTWLQRGRGRPTVGYACTVDHAKEMSEAFCAAGVKSTYLTGESPKLERELALKSLADGTFEVIWNVEILTEGWDSDVVSCGIVARPTESLALHMQIGGRFCRAAPGKVYGLLLDHAGNTTERHGMVQMDREWSLDKSPPKRDEGIAPIRTCGDCFAVYPSGMKACPDCGVIPEITLKEILADETQEMREVTAQSIVTSSKKARMHYWMAMVTEAERHSYKGGWAKWKYKDKFGSWPTADIMRCRVHRAK